MTDHEWKEIVKREWHCSRCGSVLASDGSPFWVGYLRGLLVRQEGMVQGAVLSSDCDAIIVREVMLS